MKYPEYKTYSKKKDHSQYPTSWSVQRLRFSITSNPIKSEVNEIDDVTLVSFVPMESVSEKGSINVSKAKEKGEVYSGYTYFAENDILIAKITPCFENGKGAKAKGLINGIGFGTTEFHVLRPNTEINADWLLYLTQSHLFRKKGEAEMIGAGGQKRIPEDYIKNYLVGVPCSDEQQKIAAFLDWKTGQIDALIKKKKQIIEKLEEQRTSVITQAVTKGLNPNAPMKDSEIPWLGKVPQHWDVLRAKFVSQVFVPERSKPELNSTNGIPWITMENIGESNLSTPNRFVSQSALIETGSRKLSPNAVISSCVGNFGQASINQFECVINQQLQAYICSKVAPKFLRFCILTSKDYFESKATASTLAYVNKKGFEEMTIPLPSEDEQRKIIQYVEKKVLYITETKKLAKQAILKLTEYRSSLITAATTGKIDVRDVKIPSLKGGQV
ncbi:MAG: type I restriction enzyme S subunit [Rubritalea sp.]|jgi:type I restriction enzyme S subunit